jgi:hypothetical protein
LLALAGIAGFMRLLSRVYPYEAANIRVDREQAITIGRRFVEDYGHRVDNYHVSAVLNHDSEAFAYLQQRFGFETAQQMAKYKANHGLDFFWRIRWFRNLPQDAPQERYEVLVSAAGNVIGFRHDIPATQDWIRPDRAHLGEKEAYGLALAFLDYEEIDLEDFSNESVASESGIKRTDHVFRWRSFSRLTQSSVERVVGVWGDEIGLLETRFYLPDDAATVIKQQVGREYFFDRVVSLTTLFFIGLVVLAIFLKKYHEGEVGVRSANLVFVILWSVFLIQALLKFRINASTYDLGELSPDGMALVIFLLLVLIFRPLQSIFGIAAWSVGESYGRERMGERFKGVDGILHGHFFTLDIAKSILRGLCGALFLVGGIFALFWIGMHLLDGSVNVSGYSSVVSVPVPCLIPLMVAVTGSILSEMLFRLFGNLFLLRTLKRRWLAGVFSAGLWSLYVPGFWGLQISLYPMTYELVIWFLVGLFFNALFWRYDLLTVIVASFFTMGIMQSLPLLTSSAPSLFRHGILALLFIASPLVIMIVGFIRMEPFTYRADSLPAHIRRIAERVRMTRELEIARQVQMRLLPKESPFVDGFEICGACLPAKEVGGDYYDFFDLGEGRWGITIGDVSGKGVPAAIYMTLTKGIVQSQANHIQSPAEVLVRANNLLYRNIDRDSFVSLFYAILDGPKKTLTYSRAGHNPVLLYRNGTDTCQLLEADGMALGLEQGDVFYRVIQEEEIVMGAGDLLTFYTDGLTEAMNRKRQQYGEVRLAELIQRHHGRSAQDIYQAVIRDYQQFVRDMPRHDDMTLILIKGL